MILSLFGGLLSVVGIWLGKPGSFWYVMALIALGLNLLGLIYEIARVDS